MRGVQIMGWSVRIALMACLTQNSGFRGGRKGSISFLKEKNKLTSSSLKKKICVCGFFYKTWRLLIK